MLLKDWVMLVGFGGVNKDGLLLLGKSCQQPTIPTYIYIMQWALLIILSSTISCFNLLFFWLLNILDVSPDLSSFCDIVVPFGLHNLVNIVKDSALTV